MIFLPPGAEALAPSARAALDAMISQGRLNYEEMTPSQSRAAVLAGRNVVQPDPPRIRRVEPVCFVADGIRMSFRIYAAGPSDAPALVYFHGGGFVFGGLDTHDTLCRTLANKMAGTVVSVDYRKAPETRFPGAVDDCVAALKRVPQVLADLDLHPSSLCLAGDSAGGCLAVVSYLLAGDLSLPIRRLALFYPVTDLRMHSGSHERFADGLPVSHATMSWFAGHYLSTPKDAHDWRASPLLSSDLHRLPPTYVATAGFDPLCDEGTAFADRLVEVGVPVRFDPYPGQIHGFVTMGRIMPEATQAIENAVSWLKEIGTNSGEPQG